MTRPWSRALASLPLRLRAAASHVGFFGLVRSLERELRGAPVGGDASAAEERVHFTHSPELATAGTDIVELSLHGVDIAHGEATVTTTFLGLLGVQSPLALALTEQVLTDDESGALAAFYDVFQHRAVALLYRAWRHFTPGARFDADAEDSLRRPFLSMMGIDAFSPVRSDDASNAMARLGLSDFARCEPAYLDVEALERVLRRLYPELSPRVATADAVFLTADDDHVSRLGDHRTVLGVDAAYGDGAFDVAGTVRIVVGPVDRATYEALMPGGERYAALFPVLDGWLASRVQTELEVVLRGDEAPRLALGDAVGGHLGVDSRMPLDDGADARVRVPLLADPLRAVRRFVDE